MTSVTEREMGLAPTHDQKEVIMKEGFQSKIYSNCNPVTHFSSALLV